jgi:hypothetical protein
VVEDPSSCNVRGAIHEADLCGLFCSVPQFEISNDITFVVEQIRALYCAQIWILELHSFFKNIILSLPSFTSVV